MQTHNKKFRQIAFLVLSFTLFVSGCKNRQPFNDLFTNAQVHKVKTKKKLSELIKPQDYDPNVKLSGGSMMDTATPEADSGDRDYVDTNLQVSGVDEADVIKTDGHEIYYLPRYSNALNVFTVAEDYTLSTKHLITVENMTFEDMYLLDDYVVVLGYKHAYTSGSSHSDMYFPYFYAQNTMLLVYARTDMSKVYELEFDSRVISHRIIGQSLFIVTHKNVNHNAEEVRPYYRLNDNAETTVDYSDMYYFDETPAVGFTLISGVYLAKNPANITFNTQTYLGSSYGYKQLYVNNDNMYLADTNFIYTKGNAYRTMTISGFSLDASNAKVSYLAAGIVLGGMLNQFSMDEYNGYLRVATLNNHATWVERANGATENYQSKITNYLFILKINKTTKLLTLTSYISEGLGKPGESIKSVRFDGDRAYIVTFLQTDPLYVINLKDPANPRITDEIELPGFDVYQHVWGENELLGFGHDTNEFGRSIGLKITAYDVTEGEARELSTYKLNNQETIDDTVWSYSYSEAVYNHKAMLVSPKHGIFGFPTSSYSGSGIGDNFTMKYTSSYNIFKIDFAAEQIIADPIVIEHAVSEEAYGYVDRAVLIDNYIYTFSSKAIITYDYVNDVIFEEFTL